MPDQTDDLTARCTELVREILEHPPQHSDGCADELGERDGYCICDQAERLATRLGRMMAAGIRGFASRGEFWSPDAVDETIRAAREEGRQ